MKDEMLVIYRFDATELLRSVMKIQRDLWILSWKIRPGIPDNLVINGDEIHKRYMIATGHKFAATFGEFVVGWIR